MNKILIPVVILALLGAGCVLQKPISPSSTNQATTTSRPPNHKALSASLDPMVVAYFNDVNNKKAIASETAKRMSLKEGLKTTQDAKDIIAISSCQGSSDGEDSPGLYTITIYAFQWSEAALSSPQDIYLSPTTEEDSFNRWPILYGPYKGTIQQTQKLFSSVRCVSEDGRTKTTPQPY